ncbi:hypothetical protein [Xanthobacter sediminis]
MGGSKCRHDSEKLPRAQETPRDAYEDVRGATALTGTGDATDRGRARHQNEAIVTTSSVAAISTDALQYIIICIWIASHRDPALQQGSPALHSVPSQSEPVRRHLLPQFHALPGEARPNAC